MPFSEPADFGLGHLAHRLAVDFQQCHVLTQDAGTVFHRTRTDLSKWFLAAYLDGPR